MQSELDAVLQQYRDSSKTEREKGTYFENLIQKFLEIDPRYKTQYANVQTYSAWAKDHGYPENDAGIDLVAKLIDADGFCAIQCKFYSEDHRIQKSEIDSFMTASGKTDFTRRLIVDSTSGLWSSNAEQALNNQSTEVKRINLNDLRESSIDWGVFLEKGTIEVKPKHKLREHQEKALKQVEAGFQRIDRGKMLMACGTGKTFTSLKIAEHLAGKGKRVLFLVPSLSLMSQTITEWALQSEVEIKAFAVCSDVQVGKRKANDDLADINTHDLAYPATTKPEKLAIEVEKHATDEVMTVVFATYQSIQKVSDAQYSVFSNEPDLLDGDIEPLGDFDLIICDEAHRTTGVTLATENESNFIKVHDQAYIKGRKRLYMTATPRIFGEKVKGAAKDNDALLCSMDDESVFGEVFYSLSFSEAVSKKMLTDYKVLVLAVDEAMISKSLQSRLSDENSELSLDDATKIIGCYRALTKLDVKNDLMADQNPMKRGVAFCRDIKSSKRIESEFADVVETYINHEMGGDENALRCELKHVDGTFNATARNERLAWLKGEPDENECRLLTNARCLSEGVDVPSLDAILFMHPRKSQIDVVQSVGRVMRRSEGKELGYVILPVGVPAGLSPSEALKDNEKYRVVWEILNALRAHDDRFNANINKMEYGGDMSQFIEVVAVTEQLRDERQEVHEDSIGTNNHSNTEDEHAEYGGSLKDSINAQMGLNFDEFQQAVYAKIVKKCGERNYWVDWAKSISDIAQKHITRITGILDANPNGEKQAFDDFVLELRDDLNDGISNEDAIEMLAQHIITKPVFDALFEGYSFTESNPVSKAMQTVLELIHANNISTESEQLTKFYADVQMRASGIDSLDGKQKIIVELYDKFFRNAFPRMTERLGIVYTPVEVVDFIIHSINDVLKSEFNQDLGSKGVHIIDPFTGTGTFVTRLMQSGLIPPERLEYKYKNEIHANEIVLLAYYIAAINIEHVYHQLSDSKEYQPFEGICLTDTFALYEQDHDMIANLLPDNSERRTKQKALDIRVIMGNPPYSVGQSSENDDNSNVNYENLDKRITKTYSEESKATSKKGLYDSYIRSIRWASDRISKETDKGVIGFVTNGSFVDSNATDGLRKCLVGEFSSLYIFHLRGNQRTSGEESRKEGGKIFGSGSRTPVVISLLVKNQNSNKRGKIHFHDIGDYLTQKQKLDIVNDFKSIDGISKKDGWTFIEPDKHNDWVSQRDDSFDEFIKIGDKKSKSEPLLFNNYSLGLNSNRDSWVYNSSSLIVSENIQRMIIVYNSDIEKYEQNKVRMTLDESQIKWSSSLVSLYKRGEKIDYKYQSVRKSMYRPYTKQWLYFDAQLIHRMGHMSKIFPDKEIKNHVICVTGRGSTKNFSVLLSNEIADLEMIAKGQCFPLKIYERQEKINSNQNSLIEANDYIVRDGISNLGLQHFQQAYINESISKEDIFYYVYGLLHSEEYRIRYADNLSKQLPRIPCVKQAKDFWHFSKAGRELAELHIDYETVEQFKVEYKEGSLLMDSLSDTDYRVEKMKFAKHRVDGKLVADKTTVIYNSKITMQNIPLEAYEYVVNGKPALEWVMERQAVTKDKKSGIVNDANDWAIDTMNNPKYPLELFQRVITVSLETMKIVNSLPTLELPNE